MICVFKKMTNLFVSPEFTAENIFGTRWYLSWYPKGEVDREGYCACYLHRCELDTHDADTTVDFSIEIISPSEKSLALREDTYTFVKGGNDSWGWYDICESENMLKKLKNHAEKTITIQCKIKNSEINIEPATGCNAKTNFDIDRYSFLWPLERIDQPAWSETKEFSFSNKSQYSVTLLYSTNELMINISTKNNIPVPQLIYCNVIMLDSKMIELFAKSEYHLFKPTADNDIWKFPLLDKNQLQANSILKFEFCSSHSYRSVIINYERPSMDAASALREDLRSVYISKKNSDVQLNVWGESFKAHKFVLSTRSPVFSAMFDQDMLENQTAKVEIQDTDPKTMSAFLLFLYTGTVDNMDYETALKLLILADKYQVTSLKEKCSSFLKYVISTKNVSEILYTADLVHDKHLKEFAVDHIISHAGIILPSPEWSKWIKDNYELGTEILCKISASVGADVKKK